MDVHTEREGGVSRKLLWVGDACVSSGFARATHYTLDVLRRTWDVSVLGLNYHGDPHPYPYPIYPCYSGGDMFGLGRMVELIGKIRPNVVVVQNDPWNVPAYLQKVGNTPMVATLAVDGKNCRGRGLNGLALALFWTKFGEREAQLGGYSGPSAVVPLGVDLDIYSPRDRRQAREKIGLPLELSNAFIVGNVNRNQPRKRLDLTIMYFAEWIKSRAVNDAYLFLHVAPTGETNGYDVNQLAQYYGVANRLLCVEPDIGHGVTEERLALTYCCLDALMSTTQGEGFGLTALEAAACGIPLVLPAWAALGELFVDSAFMVPCTTLACTQNKINVIGGVPDKDATIAALDALYESKHGQIWARCKQRGLALARQDCYRWENIGLAFGAALDEALYPMRVAREVASV
jgi:glycosyltransferase involved in cell wall biosynthesis